ncbi:MAG: rod shape-determining protein MreC [Halobacteria archaeon]|nr:rod shape-determining protein MreC [Halobacteria archaeon]
MLEGCPIKLIFTQGPSITTRLFVFVALSTVLMVMDHKYDNLASLRAGLSLIVYPLQQIIELPGTVSDWFGESLATRRRLQEENDSLHTQQLMQKVQMQKLAALESENIRLRELLDSSFEVGEKVLIAELMSVNLDPYKHQIVVNKGELHDIYPGQPLLDAKGVMGQIVHAGPYTSTAVLITDTSHAIPVQVNRTGLRTIALGSGTINRLDLPYIPNNADIRPGDLLITSGLGGRFPPGYPVATVQGVQHDPGQSFSQVVATPMAELNRSREVLLVWPGVSTTLEPAVPADAANTPSIDVVTPDETSGSGEEPPVDASAAAEAETP